MSLFANTDVAGRPSARRPGDFALRYAFAAPVLLFAGLMAIGGLTSAPHRPVSQPVVVGSVGEGMGAAGMSAISLQTSPHFH